MDLGESEFEEDSQTASSPECEVTSNDLILEKILSFLYFKDLLSSSLVNQRWCRMSRCEIQRSRKCYAKIAAFKACHELRRFVITFASCLILPFSGLELNFYGCSTTNCLSVKNNRFFEDTALFKKLPIRQLKVRMGNGWNCFAVQLFKWLVKYRGDEIEELTIINTSDNDFQLGDLIDYFDIEPNRSNWLPNLISLEVFLRYDAYRVTYEFVAAAPKLQVIGGNLTLWDLPRILSMKKGHLITKFRLDLSEEVDDAAKVFSGLIEAEPKLRELTIDHQYISTKIWLPILTIFVESTCYALQKLHIHHFDVLLIASNKESRLPNLKHLVVDFDERVDSQLGFVSIRKINYELVFPSLQIFEISALWNQQADLEQELPSNLLDQNKLFSCFTVKCVEIRESSTSRKLPQSMYESLVSAFPNVLALKIEGCSGLMPYLSGWENIESIDITCPCFGDEINYDALICGISKEECKYLGSLEATNPGVLEHLQVVPTDQPLLSMNKGLKTFNITIGHVFLPKYFFQNQYPALSCVSGYLVFARMPDLKVTVELNCPPIITDISVWRLCCFGNWWNFMNPVRQFFLACDTFPDLRKFVRFSPEHVSVS